MTMPDVLREYEDLASQADRAFMEMRGRYSTCVKCAPRCSDCCHAVFGLFLVEAAHLRDRFEKLERKERRKAALRAGKANREMERLMQQGNQAENHGGYGTCALEKVKVRCPLLNEANACVLYAHRPITCRVYGIPTAIQGKAHVCWKAKFEKEKTYPVFNLDEVYGKLYRLSRELLGRTGGSDPARASLLVSVSKVITTQTPDLVREIFL
jgi:Fe-S-cluster containining protein